MLQEKNDVEHSFDELITKRIGFYYIWLWVTMKPKLEEMSVLSISKESNKFIVDKFFLGSVRKLAKYLVYIDDGTYNIVSSILQFLKVDDQTEIHSNYKKIFRT